MFLVKLRPLGIQYFNLVLASVSFTPLWKTRSWACFTMRLVRGWLLGSRIGYFTAYGKSVLASRPPQRHTSFSSLKRLNCLVRVLRSDNSFCAALTQRSSAFYSICQLISCPSLYQVLESLDGSEYFHSYSNLESVLNLAGSKINRTLALGSVDTRLCDGVALSSTVHPIGIGCSSL